MDEEKDSPGIWILRILVFPLAIIMAPFIAGLIQYEKDLRYKRYLKRRIRRRRVRKWQRRSTMSK